MMIHGVKFTNKELSLMRLTCLYGVSLHNHHANLKNRFRKINTNNCILTHRFLIVYY